MARLVAVAGVACISFAAIFVRLAGVSPNTAAFFRGAYALPVLFVLWLATRGRAPRTARLRWLAVVSGVFLALDFTFWHRGIALIGAGLATVLANLQVVFVALLAWWIHAERPRRTTWAVLPIVFAGVVLASGVGRADAYGEAPLLGAVLSTGAAVCYAGFILLFRHANRMRTHPAGPMLDATLGLAIGALVFGLSDPALDLTPHWPAHGWLLALALLPQALGWICLGIALPRLPAVETSTLLLLQPVGTMAWGALFLGESPSPIQWLGASLVLAGVGLFGVYRARQVEAAPPSVVPKRS